MAFQKAAELKPLSNYNITIERLQNKIDQNQTQATLEKLKKLVKVSTKLKILQIAQILKMSENDLYNRIGALVKGCCRCCLHVICTSWVSHNDSLKSKR